MEQGSVVVYQPSYSTAVWGAEYTTALDVITSVCGCDATSCGVLPKGCLVPGAHSLQCGILGEGSAEPPLRCGLAGTPPVMLGAGGDQSHVI